MSQRRGGNNGAHRQSPTTTTEESSTAGSGRMELVTGSVSLDTATTAPGSTSVAAEERVPLSSNTTNPHTATTASTATVPGSSSKAARVGGPNRRSLEQDHASRRVKNWKESPFAVGLTEPSWGTEDPRPPEGKRHSKRRQKHSRSRRDEEVADLNENTYEEDDDDDDFFDPDYPPPPRDVTGCLCCSALLCTMLGAGRVGNMIVLKQTTEWAEQVTVDEETGQRKVLRYTRPRLQCVMGPYWPMLVFVTYPLIFVVSAWAFLVAIWPLQPDRPAQWFIAVVWFGLTMALIIALAMTACRDPGILYRVDRPPAQYESMYRWDERALTYKPRGAYFDRDTAVVVEGFDHTCPWTGTAIGARNMFCFQMFVCLVFLCLVMDIFLITGVAGHH